MENVPFWYASLSSAVSWNACEVAKWTHATTTASVCVFQRIESRGPCLCRFSPLFTRKESHKGCIDVSLTYSIYENYEQLLWANKHLCTQKKKTFRETTRTVGSHVLKNTLQGVCVEANVKHHLQPILLYKNWCANTIFQPKHERRKSIGIYLQYLEVFGLEGSVVSAKIKSYQRRSMLLHFDWFWKTYKDKTFLIFRKKMCTEECSQ